MKKDKEIVITIKKQKLQYLGHIIREEKYHLLQFIMQRKYKEEEMQVENALMGVKSEGMVQLQYTIQLFRSADSKIRVALMIANIRN